MIGDGVTQGVYMIIFFTVSDFLTDEENELGINMFPVVFFFFSFFSRSTNHLNGMFSLQSIYFKSRAFQGRTVSSILVLCHSSN